MLFKMLSIHGIKTALPLSVMKKLSTDIAMVLLDLIIPSLVLKFSKSFSESTIRNLILHQALLVFRMSIQRCGIIPMSVVLEISQLQNDSKMEISSPMHPLLFWRRLHFEYEHLVLRYLNPHLAFSGMNQ